MIQSAQDTFNWATEEKSVKDRIIEFEGSQQLKYITHSSNGYVYKNSAGTKIYKFLLYPDYGYLGYAKLCYLQQFKSPYLLQVHSITKGPSPFLYTIESERLQTATFGGINYNKLSKDVTKVNNILLLQLKYFVKYNKFLHSTNNLVKTFNYLRLNMVPGCSWDLHTGNCGYRTNGELVFLDPWFPSYGSIVDKFSQDQCELLMRGIV